MVAMDYKLSYCCYILRLFLFHQFVLVHFTTVYVANTNECLQIKLVITDALMKFSCF